MDETVEHVRVGDLRVAYRRAGSGPLLLLLHGGVCDSRVWRWQLDDLSADFTVLAWDAPGCGQSSDRPEGFGLAEYAECLAALVADLDLGPPHVLGHSWGSTLALELYRRHPDVPRTLLLAGAYAGWAGSLPRDEVAGRLELALRYADELPGTTADATAVPGLFSDAMLPDRAGLLATVMGQARPTATRAMARAMAEADLRDVLPTISVPVLLLYGDSDERAPVDQVGAALHEHIPASTLVVLPGLGHELFLESPDRFDAQVRAFLSQRSAGER